MHQHLQPPGDGRRRAAGQERRRARPAVQALGEDQPRAGVADRHGLLRTRGPDPVPGHARVRPGRLRLHHLHRQLRPADPRGHAGGRRGRPHGGLGALRQPQLRRPHPPRDATELPGLTTAGRRLRPGRLHGGRPHPRPARHRRRRPARVPARHLAHPGRDPAGDLDQSAAEHVHRRLRGPVHRRRAVAGPAHSRGRPVRPGIPPRPTCASRPTSRTCPAGRGHRTTSPAPGCWPCSATRSPPTTSPRPARSNGTPRPANTCGATASHPRTSTPTVPGAATTR